MNKRGIGHQLDWIIGISLFMLYVVFMIVTIKPGVQPLQKGETLLNIVQDNFVEDVNWEITKVPLKISSATVSDTAPYGELAFPYNWDGTKTKIIKKIDNQPMTFSISGETLKIQLYINEIVFTGDLNILHSDDELFNNGNIGSGTTATVSSYIYGVPELLKGLSEEKVRDVDYNLVKNTWNYPTTNDFNVSIKNDGSTLKEISSGIAPPSNANVYVRQFTDFILDEKGEKTPVTVTITAW